jgi:alpha-tubulin suppressor-like RCC1 family protein
MRRRGRSLPLGPPIRAALLIACSIAACGEEGPTIPPDPLETAVLEVVEGGTRGVVAQPPEVQPSVRVSTPDGQPLPDVEVSWTPGEGDGTAAETTLTDAGGVAVAAWTLGERAGTQRITARIENGAQATVEAVAEPAAAAEVEGPSVVMVGPGEQLRAPVHMVDAFGNVVPHSRATWSVSSIVVAAVNADGIVSGITLGSTVLRVEVDELTADFPLRVGESLVLERIVVGLDHACGLAEAGAAYCWGRHDYGQLGAGAVESGLDAVRVSSPEPLVSLSLGDRVSCAVSVSERGYCWGSRFHSLLGDGIRSPSRVDTPQLIALDVPIRSLDAGPHHTQCAITTGGEAYCWGHNDFGQVGQGVATQRILTPTLLPADGPVRETALSAFHGCALLMSGSTWCWGGEGFNEPGEDGVTLSRPPGPLPGDPGLASLARGIFGTCGLTADGTGFCWGRQPHMQAFGLERSLRPPAAVGDFRFESLAVGEFHACGVLIGGEGTCWGLPGQSVPGPSPVADAEQFAASWFFICALDSEGAPWCWGSDYGPIPIRIYKRNLFP